MTLTPEMGWQATALAHEAVLAHTGVDPDDSLTSAAAEHRRQIREKVLLAITDHWQEAAADA